MKITFVLPEDSLAGGIRVVAIYAKSLIANGHQVTIIAAPAPVPSVIHTFKTLVKRRQGPLPLHNPSYFDNIPVRRLTLDCYRPLQDSDVPNAEVIVATWWETAEWIAPLSPAKGTKVYFIQHHEVFDYLPKQRVEATYRLPFFQITIAQWLVDLLRDRYGATAVLVPNSVDLQQFHSAPRAKAAQPTVGFVYSTLPWKGSDVIIESLHLARQQRPDLQVIAFGQQPAAPDLPLPPHSVYRYRPAQNTLRDLYSCCDGWLFGSRNEGFGLPLLEAMACRTPVIATPTGAAPDLLAAGGGFLLRGHSPWEMAQAILALCQLPTREWQTLSAQAHDRVSQYTWHQATDRFTQALYQAIAQQSVQYP